MLLPLNYPRKSAFTLIELLVVIAIIGILGAILIPAVNAVRLTANTSKSVANLRQIGNAIAVYTNEMNGNFPLLNRRTPESEGTFFWPQALEEVVFEWDRSAGVGKHPVFEDPTVEKHHNISDYGGNLKFFGDANSNNAARVNGYMNIFKLARPATTVVVSTAYHPNNPGQGAAWIVSGSYAESGSGDGMPEARLKGNQVGLVFADGHVELVDEDRLNTDAEYRRKLFDPFVL